jgi:hypothetical protein
MITLTRSQVRRLRVAFRRAALGITHRGIVCPLVLRAEGGQLRAQYRYADLAVGSVEPGSDRTDDSLALPLDALADFEGAADTRVVLESPAPDRTVVRWEDRGIPQSREYSLATPLDRLEPMPAPPATWTSNPGELLDALAEAAETTTPDSARYALDMVQLQGGRGQLVATDGRQLLVRSGYTFPWAEDILIKGRPIFACRALPRDRPVEVGRTDTQVFFRIGPWTISCAIQCDVRFPAVERVIPSASEVGTRLRLDPADARFLESALGRLPGGGEVNSPVTVDLNGAVTVRASAPDQPDQLTEIVLNRSSYTGSPLCVCTNRALLGRALRLGHTEIGFTDAESPFVCREAGRVYAVQPLSGGSAPGPGAQVTHIESGAASDGEHRRPADHENSRRTPGTRESRDGHGPTPGTETRPAARPVEGRSATPAGASEAAGTPGSEPAGTSLAALIQEAESLQASLADARLRTSRLIAGLRRQRKQSRLLQETLRSIRQIRLVETAG